MNQYKSTARTVPAMMMAALAAFTPIQANTAPVTLDNATMTIFDAVTGALTFEWDQDSIYDLSANEVILDTNEVMQDQHVIGTLYEFVIPNFYDPLPKKTVKITLFSNNPGAREFAQPSVRSIKGSDIDFYNGGPELIVPGLFVSGGSSSPTIFNENWVMYPNPDIETITLYVPDEFNLSSIHIATQSTVPVPASFWLFGSGLLSLIAVNRRRHAKQ